MVSYSQYNTLSRSKVDGMLLFLVSEFNFNMSTGWNTNKQYRADRESWLDILS